jgi:glycogen operon protein
MEAHELAWFGTDGDPMTVAEWEDPATRSLTLFLDGDDAPDRARDGRLLVDDDFLLVVNAWWEPLDVVVPDTDARHWVRVLDTHRGRLDDAATGPVALAGDVITVGPRSLAVLRSSTASA